MIGIKEAQNKLAELKNNKYSLSHVVIFNTCDSFQVFKYATVFKWKCYYFVLTEHHGDFIEHEDEVIKVNQLNDVEIEELK